MATAALVAVVKYRNLSYVSVFKEKSGRSINVEPNLVRNCEYLNICSRIKSQLGIPGMYYC